MNENVGKRTNARKRAVTIGVNIVLIITIICFIIWGIRTYFDLDRNLYTNDAQIEEYINPINTRIPGYIREVRFDEHQKIKKGDTLVLIDDREYKIQLKQALAAYYEAVAAKNVSSSSFNTVHSNLKVSDANIEAAKARLWNAEQNYHRFENLLKDGAATEQQFDQVKTEYNSLQAQTLSLEQQRVTTDFSSKETSSKISVSEATIQRAEAAVDMARLNLSYTVILAPYDGITGRRIIQEGQLLQAGQTLMSFVRNDRKWVVANYREKQLSQLKIGKKMSLIVDGLDSRKLTGEIAAISQATGSRYAGIPVDNSTGNFVKVQQRIPVRIEFKHAAEDSTAISQLKAGMNVEVTAEDE